MGDVWCALVPPRPHPEPPRPTPRPPGRGVAGTGSGPPRALPRRGALGRGAVTTRTTRRCWALLPRWPGLALACPPSFGVRSVRRGVLCVRGAGASGPPLPPVASAAPRPRGVCVWVSRRGSTRSSPRTPPVPPAPPPAEVGLRPRRRLGARPAPVPGFSLARAGERVSERRSPPVPPS